MAPRVRLTRRVTFSAAHRYARSDWDEARNAAVFGDNVRLHGHNYVLEATVEGEVDPETGMSAELGPLDAALAAAARELGWRDLSEGVAGLAGQVPTTENLALWAWRRLEGRYGGARLVRVRLFESPELYVEVVEGRGGPEA
jgi:6-pyruvoyltetrahydropterin/6-carboxytetrahydropterin synthase